MISDYALIAVRNLQKRFLRTMLTLLGIFIGIATVVALVSLGQGMQKAINAQFASVGTDKVILQGASPGFGPPGQNAAGIVDTHDLDLVRRIPGVMRAAGRLLRSAHVESGKDADVIFVASLPTTADDRALVVEANNVRVIQGRMLKPDDARRALAGNNLWTKEHFSKKIGVGSTLIINKARFEVVGLLDKIGAGRDTALMINEDDARDIFNEPTEYSAIVAQLAPGEKPALVAERMLRAIRHDRHQKEGFEDVTVSTSEDLIKSVNTILGVVQVVFIGIALISLLVGGIGIMNTMYTAVLERKREIGIMKAIGARNGDVLTIFLFESGLLGMVGGAVGIGMGIGLSMLVEIGARGFVGSILKASFPWYLIVGALAFSFLTGVIAGIFPARQASKMPPVEAMRSD
ncbi:MAG: ABC transporter permease [Candidatus Woesearchaeota archaeon]|nr:ABC transporter permease [Candidatus Woesearchaeota archaeon]